MCVTCWEEMGKPLIRNEKTEAAALLIARVYEMNMVGGDAHIVLDDWNLEDGPIQWCLDHIGEVHTDDDPEVTRACLLALKDMTVEERASALAIFDGAGEEIR